MNNCVLWKIVLVKFKKKKKFWENLQRKTGCTIELWIDYIGSECVTCLYVIGWRRSRIRRDPQLTRNRSRNQGRQGCRASRWNGRGMYHTGYVLFLSIPHRLLILPPELSTKKTTKLASDNFSLFSRWNWEKLIPLCNSQTTVLMWQRVFSRAIHCFC